MPIMIGQKVFDANPVPVLPQKKYRSMTTMVFCMPIVLTILYCMWDQRPTITALEQEFFQDGAIEPTKKIDAQDKEVKERFNFESSSTPMQPFETELPIISKTPNGWQVTFPTGRPSGVRSFYLSNPPRLVFDVPREGLGQTYGYLRSLLPFASAIRVGSRKTATRFVLDLNIRKPPRYQVLREKTGVVVRFEG